MTLIVRHGLLQGTESEFEVRDYQYDGHPDGYIGVRVHPWHRYKNTESETADVFISVGNYNPDGSEAYGDNDGEPVWNIIVDREEFVLGLLETFPELTRASDSA